MIVLFSGATKNTLGGYFFVVFVLDRTALLSFLADDVIIILVGADKA